MLRIVANQQLDKGLPRINQHWVWIWTIVHSHVKEIEDIKGTFKDVI